ncbi:unnamed protein product, partial [marine sediment metagenome]
LFRCDNVINTPHLAASTTEAQTLAATIVAEQTIDVLAFSLDRGDAVQKVLAGKYQLALLVRATRPEQVIQVADGGETMPDKSTRFYPKPPTGFVFYRLV